MGEGEPMTWDQAERRIEEILPMLRVEQIGGMVPVQGYGTLVDGRRWYFRFRHDEATLSIFYPREDDDELGVPWDRSDVTHYNEDPAVTGDIFAGSLEPTECVRLFVRLWYGLKPIDLWATTGQERLEQDVEDLSRAITENRALIEETITEGGISLVSLRTPDGRPFELPATEEEMPVFHSAEEAAEFLANLRIEGQLPDDALPPIDELDPRALNPFPPRP